MTVVRLLRLTPNLTELTLTGHLSNYFFQSLGSDATLVPRLRHLNLSLVKLSHFLHAMGALPAQRASRGCPLQTFRFEFSRGDRNEAYVDRMVDVPHLEVFKHHQPPDTRPDAETERLKSLFWKAADGLEENLMDSSFESSRNT
ncbi:hypothetical protein V5O48_016701 [Marasmius crinis-equi]|uniref:Uncharacterized protein n=1 Tax=Marasmius crinis-equi TaxID=585013 RepID=A0ABR3EQZ6_9AGAR